ncbi:DUF2147 domain-containing protein [Helicobacter muridarum]|uniref:DUF2147 domain-containing protein n=1 Tax=Helicobacter muridarum TaxID=216 RepID=A0A377PW58_9HELI|nr:DUF2147 domain-containing protein [Helicobacter muridarum]TLD98343.1 DUF2147 domain-containing protein [Helicobacter muridarum]STQ86491.1 Uncharacterized protein conserved in bacteria [Helicobacter muridarum]
MFISACGARCIVLLYISATGLYICRNIRKVFICILIFVVYNSISFGKSLAGLYLTHKDTLGGQSIVEIFEYKNKYYIYGVKNLESDSTFFNCSNKPENSRNVVGAVFGYDYVENSKGELVNGTIHNLYNCKTYYGKIIPKKNGNIEFVGSLDSHYWFSRAYEWKPLPPNQVEEYNNYRQPMDKLIEFIKQSGITNNF